MKKLTYTNKELLEEAKQFSLYYGREELMSPRVRQKYNTFCEKVKIYEQEKGLTEGK